MLRRLCPAKLEGRDRGDLISILTADLELLEVFYAHTISPIVIATIMTVIMCVFQGLIHPALALIAFLNFTLEGIRRIKIHVLIFPSLTQEFHQSPEFQIPEF